ncbi:hypothetical protein Leryth_023657 [Lithospermum erythrorhizon]|nr:hypothetical protein Leryth_023657 [Lithospermum erythrorhizon]
MDMHIRKHYRLEFGFRRCRQSEVAHGVLELTSQMFVVLLNNLAFGSQMLLLQLDKLANKDEINKRRREQYAELPVLHLLLLMRLTDVVYHQLTTTLIFTSHLSWIMMKCPLEK